MIGDQKTEEELPPYILVVEDEGIIAMDIADAAGDAAKVEALTAARLNRALDILEKRGQPKIIFSDWGFPEGGGLGLMEFLEKKYPDVTVISISGTEKDVILRELGDAGIHKKPDAFIGKSPVNYDLIEQWSRDGFMPPRHDMERARQAPLPNGIRSGPP